MASFISHKYRMIFSHIPRTGGTSFTEVIKPFLGPDELDTAPKHTPLRWFRIGRMGKYFDDYLKVSIWRPWEDRHKSLVIGARNAAPRINKDDRSEYWWNNEQWLYDRLDYTNSNAKMLPDILISFDSLPGSAIRFLNRIGIFVDEYPHLNERE